MTDTITLRRDGIEATVKVGDKVPMTDGIEVGVLEIDRYSSERPIRINAYFEWPHVTHIDIAKLAEQQRAARPAAVPAEAIRGVFVPHDLLHRAADALRISEYSFDREIADDLLRLLGEGDG